MVQGMHRCLLVRLSGIPAVIAASLLAMLASPVFAQGESPSSRPGESLFDRIASWTGAASTQTAGAGGLTAAIAAIKSEPKTNDPAEGPAVAVHATPIGHFEFWSAATGDTFTAGTAAELARAPATVLPGVAGGFKNARLMLSAEALFAGPDVIKRLPDARSARVVIAGTVYPVERRDGGRLAVRVARHLTLLPDDPSTLREAMAQLNHPVTSSRLRMLSATGEAQTPPAPGGSASGAGGVVIDAADADRLPDAISALPRQTALLVARIAGPDARLELPSGAVRTLALSDLTAAARDADVDLLVLDTDPPRQPGGRTWLYQSISITGADRTLKARRFAEVIEPIAEARGGFDLTFAPDGAGRVRMTAAPSSKPAGGVASWIGAASDAADLVTGEVVGTLKPRAIVASLVATERRRELSWRIVPAMPSAAQWVYGATLLVGVLGWRTARRWWARLWPAEGRAEYAGTSGYVMARTVREIVFVLLFLPIAGLPAALMGALYPFRRKRK